MAHCVWVNICSSFLKENCKHCVFTSTRYWTVQNAISFVFLVRWRHWFNVLQRLKWRVTFCFSTPTEFTQIEFLYTLVGDELISSIGRGFCVLIGLSHDDTIKDVEYMWVDVKRKNQNARSPYNCTFSARKLLSIRLFDDSTGKRWQRNVKEENLELLCVSQFTLYNRLKGNKPDFHLAMQGPDASNLYNSLLKKLGEQYSEEKIKGLRFVMIMKENW